MAGAIYSDAQKSVARAFAAARLEAGLTQSDLAAAIGKHQSYISDIERGQRRLDVLELFAIARILGLVPGKFYDQLVKEVPVDFSL